jgi:chromosome segregation ATPase
MEQLTERTDTAGDGAPTTGTQSTDPFTQAKREYRELQEENERLQARIRELETENENLQSRAEAAEANADEHASRREEAETKLAQAEKAHDMAQHKIDALEGQLENAKDAAGVHPSTDVTLPERIVSLKRHLEETLKEAEQAEEETSSETSSEETSGEPTGQLPEEPPEELMEVRSAIEKRTGTDIMPEGTVDWEAIRSVIGIIDEMAAERNRYEEQLSDISSIINQ